MSNLIGQTPPAINRLIYTIGYRNCQNRAE